MPRSPARSAHSRQDRDMARRHLDRKGDRPDDEHERRRSRSPERKRRRTAEERRRSASPDSDTRESSRRHHSSHHRREKARSRTLDATNAGAPLPYSARQLGKSDLQAFEPLFVHYLGLQKQKDADGMDEREFRGRWKSFMGKWNRNELAEGWYDPEMFARIAAEAPKVEPMAPREESSRRLDDDVLEPARDEGDENDDYGPTLPQSDPRRRVGAAIPSLQDLSLRNELVEESREADREDLRASRKADRTLQKKRLEDLVPRAEPGTRERKLEKRRETNDKMRQFRDKSPGMAAGDEKELMGGGDSLEEYKNMKDREHKRKSARQVRREEIDRAKREEMEERRKAWQEREDGTVGMLRELARQRFG
ncbi:hypothetical protein TOPH_04792 [Tolypocladium ophioglossoides CBS 100239]|uniref:RNA helicase HEL117 n=1 Tax=Tolypocladium ophioglossoides (strain CBS 100239) TaxID=1163406 RepID=A0A0L0N8V3_TOLOC|nr:hypothetical protein TOPH_04792 [Tolypocladium ophioglossoides CBS 100239]